MNIAISLLKKKTFMIVMFSLVLLIMVTPLYASAAIVPCDGARTQDEPAQIGGGCDFTDIIELIRKIITFLLFSFAVPLAAISFAIAGVMILTAGGNENQVTQAKEIFWNVLIGLIVALAAWLVVNAILIGLGAKQLGSF